MWNLWDILDPGPNTGGLWTHGHLCSWPDVSICFLASVQGFEFSELFRVWVPGCELSAIWESMFRVWNLCVFSGVGSVTHDGNYEPFGYVSRCVKSLFLWTITDKDMISLTSVLFLRGAACLVICVTVWEHCLSVDWGSRVWDLWTVWCFVSYLLNCFRELNLKEMRSLRYLPPMPLSELLEPLGGCAFLGCELPELSGVCVQVWRSLTY